MSRCDVLVRYKLPTAHLVDISAQLFISSRDRKRNDDLPHLRARPMVAIPKYPFRAPLDLLIVRRPLFGRTV